MENASKNIHEIRDPIHVFVRLDSDERKVLNSRCFQRLRHIHQLALTNLVYPGATHKRFEHSLGVMELAARVYDVVTNPLNVTDDLRGRLEPLTNDGQRYYWLRVLRMAALCHDVGHLPFSHAAEKELLPECWDHERITRAIVSSEEMKAIWDGVTPPLRHEHIVKLALGPEKASDLEFTDWEFLLSEIIVGDAFGVDRMDYLLRDSHHIGVAYGKFDHYRLIDTLRILPAPQYGASQTSDSAVGAPALGVEAGGVESAEALVLARYFMYSQVYFHAVRRIYDMIYQGDMEHDFPVRRRDGKVVSSLSMSEILNDVPGVSVDFVFADREIVEDATVWLDRNRDNVIKLNYEGRDDGEA